MKKLKKLELSPQNSLSGVLHLLYSDFNNKMISYKPYLPYKVNNESQNSIMNENTEMIGSVNVKVELQNSDIQTVTPKLQKKVYRQLIQTAVLKVLGNPVDRTNLPMDVELSKL